MDLSAPQFKSRRQASFGGEQSSVALSCRRHSPALARRSNTNTILSPTADPKKSLRDVAFDLPGRFPIARWAPIPLRLSVGFGFMEHGFAKLSKGPDSFAAILHVLAVPAPHFMAWASILIELLGAFALRVQFDQAHGRDCYRRAVWTAGL